MTIRGAGLMLATVGLVVGSLWCATVVRGAVREPGAWDRKAAAKYLDDREVWWQGWPRAQKDQETVCVSCHTQVPYAMVRPELRRDLGEGTAVTAEARMMESVEKRVNRWSEVIPFYSDAKNGPGKTAEARATEAVMNAVMLASYDAEIGHLRPVTRLAFDHAWATQESSGDLAGAWIWQNFHLGPWEGEESGYQGAALLMVAALEAPDGYNKEPAARQHLGMLAGYLRRHYAEQPVMNRLYVLWASGRMAGLLTGAERSALLASLHDTQEADGGWRTAAIDERERKDDSADPDASDGYATGLAVLAMEEARVGQDGETLRRGVGWLEGHQQADGAWQAVSINKKRDPASDPGLFMQDAATAYAVMALDRKR